MHLSPANAMPILPPSTIGVFGSGQLGRMLGLTARRMGYGFAVFGPEADSPAGQIADIDCVAAYNDEEALRAFARRVEVITFEFENVPAHVARIAGEEGVPVRPAGGVLHTTQQRLREKRFLRENHLPMADFAEVHSLADLHAALVPIAAPAVLKTAAFGYDGKGQVRIDRAQEAEGAWQTIGGHAAVLEAFVDFACEISVVAARGLDGSFAHYGAFENRHANHILDLTLGPARIDADVAAQAVGLARSVGEALAVVGVFCVELFVTRAGVVLVNEVAPRPHNSGHLTIEAAACSQFEQQLRAVCGLPLGATALRPAAMANLLGDLWDNGVPDWAAALAIPGVALHLYGKREPRMGRKMGHLTAVAPTVEEAEARVLAARDALRGSASSGGSVAVGRRADGGA